MSRSVFSRRLFLGSSTAAVGLSLPLVTQLEAAEVAPIGAISTDVLVCGGGPSGMAAAVMAARQGVKTLLLERYGRLGGMAVHARVGPLMGSSDSPFVREVLKRIGGPRCNPELLDLQYASLVEEAGGEILLHSWVFDVVKEGNSVHGVRFLSKEGIFTVEAKVVIDGTGDGDVACAAGAQFEKGRASDGLLQPMSIMFTVAGVDWDNALFCGSEEEATQIKIGDLTWEQVVHNAQKAGMLPANVGVIRTYRGHRPGCVIVNATQVNQVDGTKVADLTKAELEGRRQALQVLEVLRQFAPGYKDAYIAAMPAVIGVRETRRFLGEYYLTRDDLLAGRKHPDAVVKSANFVIDIHNPAGPGQAEGFAQRVKPYDIPYRCLVPKTIDNLLLAGRCISGSHDAHASYRVQQIAMAIGAAAGTAAAVAVQCGSTPRQVDVRKVQSILWPQT